MAKITVNEEVCKGCGLCANACPKKLIQLSSDRFNKKGYPIAEMTDESLCIACAFCATMCPDSAITVEK